MRDYTVEIRHVKTYSVNVKANDKKSAIAEAESVFDPSWEADSSYTEVMSIMVGAVCLADAGFAGPPEEAA